MSRRRSAVAVASLALLAVLVSWQAQETTEPPAVRSVGGWEYKQVWGFEELETPGKDGWELVDVVPGAGSGFHFFMKRSIAE
jgi:hypothetical protein